MRKNDIIAAFLQGQNCAQCVLARYTDEHGYDVTETDAFAKYFGGGMMMQHTCGAVTGAIMAMGLLGGSLEDIVEFEAKFQEQFGSCMCRELLDGMSLSEAKESGKMMDVCPGYVEGAEVLVKEIMGL